MIVLIIWNEEFNCIVVFWFLFLFFSNTLNCLGLDVNESVVIWGTFLFMISSHSLLTSSGDGDSYGEGNLTTVGLRWSSGDQCSRVLPFHFEGSVLWLAKTKINLLDTVRLREQKYIWKKEKENSNNFSNCHTFYCEILKTFVGIWVGWSVDKRKIIF